ncbi:hypothetical protein FTV88_3149 [Heliorestis convoluta]|uniref:Uncharacterized protein n=1 Tax=Heliorestis convoluta TaxID=356322 RepID=A0A5Q2N5K9_9FIRM|nr:hypothetical protein FTV88_3149 [Heliorestis convoluta]
MFYGIMGQPKEQYTLKRIIELKQYSSIAQSVEQPAVNR